MKNYDRLYEISPKSYPICSKCFFSRFIISFVLDAFRFRTYSFATLASRDELIGKMVKLSK